MGNKRDYTKRAKAYLSKIDNALKNDSLTRVAGLLCQAKRDILKSDKKWISKLQKIIDDNASKIEDIVLSSLSLNYGTAISFDEVIRYEWALPQRVGFSPYGTVGVLRSTCEEYKEHISEDLYNKIARNIGDMKLYDGSSLYDDEDEEEDYYYEEEEDDAVSTIDSLIEEKKYDNVAKLILKNKKLVRPVRIEYRLEKYLMEGDPSYEEIYKILCVVDKAYGTEVKLDGLVRELLNKGRNDDVTRLFEDFSEYFD